MRYGTRIGTAEGLLWGMGALVVGLVGLAAPLLLVAIALILAVRAVLWMRPVRHRGENGGSENNPF